jgi:HD-GYP domain-containing protein (c-di-GMP phosphodiesterase class II)
MSSVPTSLLRAARIDADLYVAQSESDRIVLYAAKDVPIGESELLRLESRGIRELLVCHNEAVAYYENLLADSDKNGGSSAVRFRAVMEARKQEFEQEYHQGSVEGVVDVSGKLSNELVGVLCDPRLAIGDLMSLMRHDDGTFTHCVNVASFAILLAWHMGVHSQDELHQVALGGLMHDIGKRHIPKKILNSPNKLSPAEMGHIREHPRLGFLDVFPREGISFPAALMVYQHHERADGSGYPVGSRLDEIHPWARICAVADVFHALTSVRPYRKLMDASSACVHLAGEMGAKLDEETTQCWITLVMRAKDSPETLGSFCSSR